MAAKMWNLSQEQLEQELLQGYNVALSKLLNNGVIDEQQCEEAFTYAPRLVFGDSLMGWLKDKLFPEDHTGHDVDGRHMCVKLYDAKDDEQPKEDDEELNPIAEEMLKMIDKENLHE
tara:strand:+ start:37 stop:387 length:351 start_codon:yes stop_codon:yes gene_type:complete